MGKPAKKAAVKKEAKPRKPRAPKVPKAAAPDPKQPAPQVAGANSVDRDMQNLARVHRDKYIQLRAAQVKANTAMKNLGKLVKADGLQMSQIKLMVQLSTPEGELEFKEAVAANLMAAQWQGAAIGAQLQLFLEPDRTPSVDMAYEEGVQDCMDGKTANPGYDPSVPQYASYMKGYHDETERRVQKGFKVKEADEPDRATLIKAAREENDEFFDSATTKH